MTTKCTISQGFGQNANPLYNGQGLKGHTGVDEACGYGTPIYALKHGYVFKIIDDVHPAYDGSGYWAVFIVAPDINGTFCEWQIGHVSKVLCKVGDTVEPWTIVAEEGNHGDVYFNQTKITKAMQDAGDHRGSHRHWNKKICIRQDEAHRESDGGMHLTDFNGTFKDPQDFYYQVQDYKNGYNGSVDCIADIDAGYASVTAHIWQDDQVDPVTEKLIVAGLAEAKKALAQPKLKQLALALLKSLSDLLSRTKK